MPKKLYEEGIRTSALDNRARTTDVQDATMALPLERINAKNSQDGKTANPEKSPRRDSFLFPAIVLTSIDYKRKPKPSAVLMSNPYNPLKKNQKSPSK